MPTAVVLNPKITSAGQAAAIAQDGLGLQLSITHVAFGTGEYNPTGAETALATEVKRVTIPAGALVTPTQLRLTAVWESDVDNSAISEIGFFAGTTLFAVWSRATGGPIGYKTPGVDFVLFHDLKLSGVPAGSITIQVEETAGSVALAALGSHEAADNAHSQYVRKDGFPDANALLACAVTGTANALVLTPPVGVEVPAYAQYQKVAFIASAENTGAVTANVAGLGVKSIKKGGDALVAGDIRDGGYYELVYDGTNLQISGGVGGGATLTSYRFVATAGQTAFTGADADAKTLAYTPGLVIVFRAGAMVPFTGADGATITLGSGATLGDEVVIIAFAAFTAANAVQRTGDTMTGPLVLSGNATLALGAVTKQQLEAETPAASETVAGKIEIATSAEAQALADALRAITPASLNAALKGANQSLSASGYQKLPGGLIVQWGTTTQTSTSNGFTTTVTLPIAFPSAIVGLYGNLKLDAVLSGCAPVNLDPVGLSQISVTLDYANGSEGTSVSRTVYWLAIGY